MATLGTHVAPDLTPAEARYEARVASIEQFRSAQAPVWDPVREGVLLVDVEEALVIEASFDGGQVQERRRHVFAGSVGAAVPSEDGELLVTGQRDLHVVGPDGVAVAAPDVLPSGRASRLSTGACDPAGRLLFGSATCDSRAGEERLCRWEPDRGLTVLDDDLTAVRGLAWSPDGSTLYSVDGGSGSIWARDYDVSSGEVGERYELLHLSDGTPAGLCTDVSGHLWVATFGVGEVRCFTTDGDLRATVEVPAPHVTDVAFVGPDRDVLLITSARHQLSADRFASYPDSGRLFVADVGVRGTPVAPWCGG